MERYFKKAIAVGVGTYIHFWKCKSFSAENISAITASNHIVTAESNYFGIKIRF